MSVDTGIARSGAPPQEPPRRRPWRSIVFAPEGDGRRAKRGSDGFRLGASVVIVLAGLAVVRLNPGPEHAVAHFLSPPPDGVSWLVSTVYLLGSFGTIVV